MNDIIATMKKLPKMGNSIPADKDLIKNSQEILNLQFAEDYKKYLSEFGTVWSDVIVVSGLNIDEDYDVVKLTTKLRSIYPLVPNNFYVIEDVGVDGLVIWQDLTGAIYQSIPNRQPEKINNNLTEYIKYVLEG